MIIRKFKNGKISLKLEVSDIESGEVNENVYHDEMFMEDLSIQADAYDNSCIVDWNTERIYRLGSYLMQNPLKFLLDELHGQYKANKVYHLVPESLEDQQEYWNDYWSEQEED